MARVEWGEAGRKAGGWLVEHTFPDVLYYTAYFEIVRWWPTWQEVSGGFQVLGLEVEAGWVAWAACAPPVNPRPPPDQPQLPAIHQQLLIFLLHGPTPEFEQVAYIIY